ncbi:hypothetical protein BKA63DRAFT_198830 [Paraphoma chrysanthemicola]|nr:hypothetical protein BKA63DRAFT_198830 [Paraphoma chrysanthemicola]
MLQFFADRFPTLSESEIRESLDIVKSWDCGQEPLSTAIAADEADFTSKDFAIDHQSASSRSQTLDSTDAIERHMDTGWPEAEVVTVGDQQAVEDPSFPDRTSKKRKTSEHGQTTTSNVESSTSSRTAVSELRNNSGTTEAEGQHFLVGISSHMEHRTNITPCIEEERNIQDGDIMDLDDVVDASETPSEAATKEIQRSESDVDLTIVGHGETPCDSSPGPLNYVASQSLQSGQINDPDTGDDEQEASSSDIVGEHRPQSEIMPEDEHLEEGITNAASVNLEDSTAISTTCMSTVIGPHEDNNTGPEPEAATPDISPCPPSASACDGLPFVSYAVLVGDDFDSDARVAFGLDKN